MTSSKLYPQSNGFIEGSVQTVKNLLRIAEASGQDPYLALLIYRSTPVDKNLPSPARLLNHRDITAHSYQTLNSHRAQLQNRQNIQRKQYDSRSTRELRNLIQGEQAVVFQPRTLDSPHFSGILPPSLIFSCTTIAGIFAYFKYIVSYCCSRENETSRQCLE